MLILSFLFDSPNAPVNVIALVPPMKETPSQLNLNEILFQGIEFFFLYCYKKRRDEN